MNKYRNKKVIVEDYGFDSIQESRRYKELKLLLKARQISNLELQPHFLLQDSFKKNGKTYRKIEYIADFKYIEEGKTIVEDVKGMQTDVFKLKRKLFEKKYPDLELRIIK
nr:MAG TPA: Endonuclease [Caudoviricetes sp.]